MRPILHSPALMLGMLTTLASGCRPDPAAVAMTVPDPSEPPPRFATTGDTIAIAMVRERVRTVSTVTMDGTIEAPLCGLVEVGGRQAHDICNEVSACLARYYRSAAVMVTIDGEAGTPASSGCAIEGPPKAEGWAETSRAVLRTAEAAADVDPRVLVRAAEVAADYEVALVERTDEHPDVASIRSRVERLVQATSPTDGKGDPGRARNDLSALIVQADLTLARLSNTLGSKHPQRRAAQARRDLLAQIEAAMPDAEPTPAALAVERVEVAAQLELARARLGPKHPQRMALQARATHLQESPTPPVPCEALRQELDVRLARLQGQREAGGDDALDPVIDALAIARAQIGHELACEAPPSPEPELTEPKKPEKPEKPTPKRASSRR